MTATAPPELPSADSKDAADVDPAGRRRWSRWLPWWLRGALMGALFFWFFVGAPVISLVILPTYRLLFKDHRRRCTRFLNRGLRLFIATGRFMGTADFENPVLPPSVDPDKPYVMISNHPSYIDMLMLLGSFPNMTCVTSGRWSRHWGLGPILRSTDYLPGPGSGLPQSEDMLESMVAHLRAGNVLLVFPEGKRSHADSLRKFRRGAVAAAFAANVPIVPLFLAMDQPYLTKEVPIWKPPSPPPLYTFEWFDVVRPDAFAGDAKRAHRHIVELYEARFAAQRARQKMLRASS